MEREILFRGKRVDNGEWVEGFYNLFEISGKSVPCIILFSPITNIFPDKKVYQIDPQTRSEYTGLTDKNGKKIFEGDIVSFADCWDTQHKGVVYWRSGSYDVDCSKSDNEKVSIRLFTAYACGAKIIGNIHDNPELLKGQEK